MSSTVSIDAQQRDSLCRAAMQARELSYSPYSKFRVGAALLFANGDIVQGANVENASYGGTICAERTAIVKAQTTPSLLEASQAGGASQPKLKAIVAIAVSTDLDEACSPCGICRQVLREFCHVSTPILMLTRSWTPGAPSNFADGDKTCVAKTLEELLPMSFGPDQLDLPRS